MLSSIHSSAGGGRPPQFVIGPLLSPRALIAPLPASRRPLALVFPRAQWKKRARARGRAPAIKWGVGEGRGWPVPRGGRRNDHRCGGRGKRELSNYRTAPVRCVVMTLMGNKGGRWDQYIEDGQRNLLMFALPLAEGNGARQDCIMVKRQLITRIRLMTNDNF